MFTTEDILAMQATQNDAMPDTGVIKRRSMRSDGFGGHTTDSIITIQSGVPARVTPAQTMAMGGQGDRSLELDVYTLRFPWGTDIRDRDYYEWEGQTLEITDVKVPRSFGTVVTAKGEVVKGA